MDVDWSVNEDSKEHLSFEETDKEQLQFEENDDSYKFEFIQTIPVIRDTDGSYTTECVSGDWSAEVKPENLVAVKQEPDDVCMLYSVYHNRNESRSLVLLPSNRHHRSNGDCLEGKRESYQVCSVQYCVQKFCAEQCTHI